VRCGRRLATGWIVGAASSRSEDLGRRHVATKLFMLLSVGVYVALLLGGGGLFEPVRRIQAVHWGALVGRLGLAEPWRFLAAMFVHFNLLHVGFNTMALQSLGRSLEENVGSARFTLIFLGTGIGGFVASQLVYSPQPLTGGISGGVFGLLGAAVGWSYAQRDKQWKRLALTGAGYAVAMALIPGQQVNNAAHVGGLLLGAGLAWALYRLGRRPRAELVASVFALVLVLATFASIGLSLASSVTRKVPRLQSTAPLEPSRLRLTGKGALDGRRLLEGRPDRQAADPNAFDLARVRLRIDRSARSA
jgi:membrane associated rhomboid family serine protease